MDVAQIVAAGGIIVTVLLAYVQMQRSQRATLQAQARGQRATLEAQELSPEASLELVNAACRKESQVKGIRSLAAIFGRRSREKAYAECMRKKGFNVGE